METLLIIIGLTILLPSLGILLIAFRNYRRLTRSDRHQKQKLQEQEKQIFNSNT
jgi:hypothetical protein